MNKADPSDKIIDLMKYSTEKTDAARVIDKSSRKKTLIIDAKGNANVTIAGRDIVNNYNEKNVIHNKITPTSDHISQETAKKIQDIIGKIVSNMVASGKCNDKSKEYAKIQKQLKNKFKVTSYLLIPAESGDDAIKWLNTKNALSLPKLRRTNNTIWKNEIYKGIWARSKQLGIIKSEVYEIAEERYGKKIDSLKMLGERNLKDLYDHIMKLKK
jgi:hypothetical protein